MRWLEMVKGETSDITSTLSYLIRWPLTAPLDAWRAGEGHHVLTRLLVAIFPGLPLIGARFLVGPFLAAWQYYRAQ